MDYLMAVRPRAMGSYLAFLKEAGRHLDPKTRAVISVITKVASQTEAGFKQYLRKALQAGVSADEILDALLVAFPVLGLARITWAVDRIIAWDLPEFRKESLAAAANWHDLLGADELAIGDTKRMAVAGREVFIHRNPDGYRVYDARCPHQGAIIQETGLSGGRLTCALHGWTFALASGACIKNGSQPLHHYECKVEDGRLWACVK
jgi:nitrite reductase/ring-hydroxylating ferredoxin subunit